MSWTTQLDALNRDIRARAYDAEGTALDNQFVVIANSANQRQSTVAGLTNGNYVIAWTDDYDATAVDASGSHIAASIFSGNGTAAGLTNFLVNTGTTAGDQSEPTIAGRSSDGFVVAWTTPNGGTLDIDANLYTSEGFTFFGEAPLVPGSAHQFQASIAALSNGQFVFSWTDTSSVPDDGSGTHIGVAGGDYSVANTRSDGDQSESSVTVLADGRFLVVWTNGGLTAGAPDPAPNAVYGQIFDARTAAVNLVGIGSLNNEWVGTGLGDAMDGAAGNDRIDGAGGNDNLLGGLGQDTLIAGRGADKLFGNADSDTLDGGGGNDGLDGGTGADLMRGGAGDDSYAVDDGDVVSETGGNGTDLVTSARSFSLADSVRVKGDVEQLTLVGNANLNGIGNGLNNIIIGNAGKNALNGGLGNDRLDGSAGVDTLVGGKGNDTFFVDNKLDKVIEANNGGLDQVFSSVSFSLAGQFAEKLTLTGTANRDRTGNQLNNVIAGNTGKNVLNGVAGNDQLNGGAGFDTLIGGIGNDRLDGGAGNDRLTGGAGNDRMAGAAGNDTFVFAGIFGRDVIADFKAGPGAGDVMSFAKSLFANFAAVRSHASLNGNNDVVISFNPTNAVTLDNIHRLADLHASDFVFV